jgi:Na+/H+ antiporter NhaC
MPAALIIFILYIVIGKQVQAPDQQPPIDVLKVVPYIVVLVTAIFGMNVMAVLTLGILLTGVIGIATGSYDLYGWLGSMGQGILGMGELIIITLMAGGLLAIIKQQGGIDYLIRLLTRRVSGKRGAELSVAALVSMVNVCTANNTVAIITVGGIAKQIGDRYGIDNRKCASILDTFSCSTQGLLPYGAQMLMAAGLAQLNPVAIIPYLYYPFAIGIVALLAIIFRFPKRYS